MLSTDLTDDAHHVMNLGHDHFMSRSSALGTLLFFKHADYSNGLEEKPSACVKSYDGCHEQGLIQHRHHGHTGSRPVQTGHLAPLSNLSDIPLQL